MISPIPTRTDFRQVGRTLIHDVRLSGSMSTGRKISLIEEDDGRWSAIDEETGVASYGDTRSEALEMLDEAVALHEGEAGEPVTDEDLEELGINPESVPDEPQEPDAPWFDDAEESA
jgi:predicted RNase H-like HicB family nuclease